VPTRPASRLCRGPIGAEDCGTVGLARWRSAVVVLSKRSGAESRSGRPILNMSRMLEEIRQQPTRWSARWLPNCPHRALQTAPGQAPRADVLAARARRQCRQSALSVEVTTDSGVAGAPAIHTLYNAHMDYRDALVVGISQSGESTDTNLVLSRAREQAHSHRHHQRALQHAGTPGRARLPVRAGREKVWPLPKPTPARC